MLSGVGGVHAQRSEDFSSFSNCSAFMDPPSSTGSASAFSADCTIASDTSRLLWERDSAAPRRMAFRIVPDCLILKKKSPEVHDFSKKNFRFVPEPCAN